MNVSLSVTISDHEVPFWIGYALMHGYVPNSYVPSMTEPEQELAVEFALNHRILTTFPLPPFIEEEDGSVA